MEAEKGQLSINSENMFPIIKKWLYSDHDIFYRELISNGCDAITKLKKLDMMGETDLPQDYQGRIDIVVDPKEKTIDVSDNGLGMTADEVREYINSIAFSGAEAFLDKYKDKTNDDQIIGHFGLGFYSAFMVAELVEINTLSWEKDAKPVHWQCDGSSEYEMDDGTRDKVGTTVTLHLSEDCVEFSNYYRAEEVIQKYCGFMPYEIYLSEKDTDMTQTIKESERRPDDIVIEVIEPKEEDKESSSDEASSNADKAESQEKKERELKIRKRPELVNDTHPLWTKNPSECTDDEYKIFYRKLFNDYKEPLFWIHLNMDYPFHLKGILYFPKVNLEYENYEGTIKLYNNQVFVADNIKEVIPEYLLVLRGVIDCPDLPLNVSRSALQNDGFAKKISDYISKKVVDKLSGMCKTDRKSYEKYWDDISPFIKYGCLKDDKFCKKMTDYILFKDLDGNYMALPDALKVNRIDVEEESAVDENGKKVEADIVDENGNTISSKKQENESKIVDATGQTISSNKEEKNEEEEDRTIYYVTDVEQQGQYIRMFREHKLQAFILNSNIDVAFIQQLEMKNEKIHFERIDAGVDEVLKGRTGKKAAKEMEEQSKQIEPIVRKAVGKNKLVVKVENLKDKDVSSILKVDEQNRRMQDMMKMYAASGYNMGDIEEEGETLILNAKHPLVQYVLENMNDGNAVTVCEQLYDLAKIQNSTLDADEMKKFVERSNRIMMILTGTDKKHPKDNEKNEEEKSEEGKSEEGKSEEENKTEEKEEK